MARQAYPDVPLYRYEWTALSEGAMRRALGAVAARGPEKPAAADHSLAGQALRIAADSGPALTYRFDSADTLSWTSGDGSSGQAGYGALTLDHITLFAHLVPGTLGGYAVAFDHDTRLATVVELWFGDQPRPREVYREIYHGYVAQDGAAAPEDRHKATARVEGRGIFWTDDRGHETIEFYASTIYSHVVDRTRLDGRMGYSYPSDYIKLTEDIYLLTRTEAEFSGIMTLHLVDMNRLEQAGLRIGFDGLDALEYYMFTGTGEWTGQIARFEEFGDVSGNPIEVDSGKGSRPVYRPLATMDKLTEAEIDVVAATKLHVFDEPSAMAGHGLPPTDKLAGRQLAIRYDGGPRMEYRFTSADELQWRKDGEGGWTTARYNAWEGMPGVFTFGHMLMGTPKHDAHMVAMDLDAGLATVFRGYVKTPYIPNEAWSETMFGVVEGEGVPDAGSARHRFTDEVLGRAFTWSYSPGLTSMHLYSTPNTVSWVIFTPDGHGGMQWSGPGEFVKIRDGLYFLYWREDACNGALGTILVNMRTMHDSGIGYHCNAEEIGLGPVGAYARHAGRFDIGRFFNGKDKA